MKLIIHNLDTGNSAEYADGNIPAQCQWAFDHIVEQECESISCGTTVYEVKP